VSETESTYESRPRPRTPDLIRRAGVTVFTAGSLVVGFIVGEATLIAPVVFLAGWLGFWPGMVVFTGSCVILGLAVLGAVGHFWPSRNAPASTKSLEKGPVRTALERLCRRSRTMGALAVAWYCGPFASPPILRAFGYQGRRLMTWVVASGFLFGTFWFSFYGGAFSVIKRVLL
jgi:hypothetical protein